MSGPETNAQRSAAEGGGYGGETVAAVYAAGLADGAENALRALVSAGLVDVELGRALLKAGGEL